MKTIWKYALKISDDRQEFTLPVNAAILFVAAQGEELCMWVEVPTDRRAAIKRIFKVHGTGHPIHPADIWRGSAVIPPFVWHVYEVML